MAEKVALTNQDLIGNLRALGFTEYEARVYIALIESPPSTAYELSKSSGVPRPNTYSALTALAARGAAMPVSERPVRYVAQRPDSLFDTISAQTRELCNRVATELSQLSAAPSDHYVWNLEGETDVHLKVRDLIENAGSDIWFKADPETLRLHDEELRRAAMERGVRMMIILFGPEPDEFRYSEKCKVYVHEASGVRMGSADNLFTIAVDHKEMLTANDDGIVRASYTENKSIVKMALSLLRHDYYMAEIFNRFKDEIDAAFGPNLRSLRLASYTDEQIKSFEEKTSKSD